MSHTIGIDLGTTNSRVAIMEDGVPRIVRNQEGASSTPSIVAFTASGERLVGSPASRQGLANTHGTVSGVLRVLARGFNSREVAAARQSVSCVLTEGPDGGVRLGVQGKIYSATDVLSSLLADLKTAAEARLGESAEGTVISCPAHFYDAQRRAIKDAAILAGFKTVSLVNATTAVALAYRAAADTKAGVLAVFHLGGGSFEVSIVELANGLCIVRGTAGEARGGMDFDQHIVDWLCAQARREFGIAFQPDGMALMRLKEAAERAKCELSTAQKANISLPFLSADRSGPKHLNTVLTRQQYEALTRDLIERLVELSRRCIGDAGLEPSQVDQVLLVGGQTRAPRIRQLARRLFGRETSSAVDPETAVSIGAAIQGSRLAGGEREDTVLEVAFHTLGIEGDEGESIPLIERNRTIPARKRVLIPSAMNPSRIQVHLLQGEGDIAAQNESLGWRQVTGNPAVLAGERHVEVGFGVDEDGIVYVESLAELTHKGHRAAESDLDGAIADCDEAILRNPGDASAYQKRGSVRFDKGDFDGALADYDEAIRLSPDDAATYMKRGYTRVEEGDLSGALEDLRQAIHLAEASRATRIAGSVVDRSEDLEVQANLAFFSGDYEGFLRWNLESSKHSPRSGWAEAGVASAYACKFAVSGAAEYKAQTLGHLAKARRLARESGECAACLREYEERTIHRLENREIISSWEYERRFPKGGQTRRLRARTHH